MKISSQWLKPLSVDLLKHHCTSVANCKQAHAVLLRFDLLHENILSSKLLSFLALSSSGDLKYAHQLFDQLSSPDSFIWNTMIRGYARSPKPSQAISFFLQMVSSGVAPDHHSYPFVLTACARMLSPELGKMFHAETLKFGLESDVFVLNSLIQMYACCGLLGDARKLFDGNPIRDVVSWNVMIRGYVKRREFEQAFGCFDDMIQGNIQPDSVTMICLVSGCSQLGDLDRGRHLHTYSCELGFVASNLQLGNSILDMYCKCGDLSSAKNLFDEMDERDLLTWTSMISGFTTSGNFHDALELFSQMQNERIHPDEMVLGTMLSVCAQMGALDEGKYIHRLIEKYNVKLDVVLQTSLIDMYAKCGRVDLAMQVFKKMEERNVFTWNAMIGGLAIHGHGHLALDLFEEMKHGEEAVADDVTFIGLLLACSHSGLVKAGLKIFNEMEDLYHIHPRMEHYGCVVDLLCRAGLVQDALDFMEKMPVKPNEVLWASLIGACRVLGQTNIAEMLSKNMIDLDPESCGRYVILSNLYAGVRRWDDALRVRNLMRAKGIDKTPGLSWIELNGIVHQFVAGDRSHIQTEDIYMMVTEMCQRARLAGHKSGTSEVLFDIEEEEKEHSLFFHSEKLAVAFGLMSTAPGSNIRITKNLRVCHDCHSFLKAISKVFNRDIVARDRSRFHYFRGGLCSCKDFW